MPPIWLIFSFLFLFLILALSCCHQLDIPADASRADMFPFQRQWKQWHFQHGCFDSHLCGHSPGHIFPRESTAREPTESSFSYLLLLTRLITISLPLHTVKIQALLRKSRTIASELSGRSRFYFCNRYSVIAAEGSANLGMLRAWACQLLVRQMCYCNVAEGRNHKWFSGKTARLAFDYCAAWFQRSCRTVFCSPSLQHLGSHCSKEGIPCFSETYIHEFTS